MIASHFGAMAVVDAYYLALAVPGVLIGVLGGTIKIAVMPFFVEERLRRPDEAERIVGSGAGLLVVGCGIGTLALGGLALAGWLEFGASREVADLSRRLMLELLPLIPLTVLFHFYSAVYNSYQRFALPEICQMARYVIVIGFLWLFARRWGVHSIILGHVVGQAAALGLMIWFIGRQLGIELRPRWTLPVGLRRLLLFSLVPFASYVFVQLNPLIARVIAAQLPEGSIAVLSYAEKLASIPSLIMGAGFASVLVSHWSRLTVLGEIDALRTSLNRSLSLLLAMLVPMAVGLVMLRDPIVRIAFERGAFGDAATAQTSQVFAVLALQIIPFYLHMVTVRVLLAEKAMAALAWLSALGFVAAFLFMQLFVWTGLGVVGVALGSVIGTIVVAAATAMVVDRRYGVLAWSELSVHGTQVLVATIIMVIVLLAMRQWLLGDTPSDWLLVVGATAGGGLAYLAALWWLGHELLVAVRNNFPLKRSNTLMDGGDPRFEE
ncbi:MAG TPA: oligosaccharide flippase family protein [Thermoanaerobaculia bacterium]|nr:oligosaccharide flippase family protein [Thermoanaerobaculia bacterium]